MKLILEDKTTVEIIDNSGDPTGQTFSDNDELKLPAKQSLSKITQFASEAIEEFKKIGNPDEVEITFGIEAGGEGGFFGLAKVHSKATIDLKAKWVKK